MSPIRVFSSEYGNNGSRTLEDAPSAMRQEIIGAIYAVAENRINVDEKIYYIIEQALGVAAAGNPVAGRRQRLGRDLRDASWQRVYDVIVDVFPVFRNASLDAEYCAAINRILTAYGIAWDLGPDGNLHRVLPGVAAAQVTMAFEELRDPIYAAALGLLKAASEAYDGRPRRDRDVCANAFDALESVAKAKLAMPTSTFGQVLVSLGQQHRMSAETVRILENINTMRNHHFGHGMTTPFQLSAPEVDFIFLACIAAILLFARMS